MELKLMSLTAPTQGIDQEREFKLAVLGRTLDHLGRQTYKRRDVAIVELVANCWDAGARNVLITIPTAAGYDQDEDTYVIEDDGTGMSEAAVENDYLVVGRNRREGQDTAIDSQAAVIAMLGEQPDSIPVDPQPVRSIMGRKGIGKLAGFGIAKRIIVATWRDGVCTRVVLDADELRVSDGSGLAVPVKGWVGPVPSDAKNPSGTRVTLYKLKHRTPLGLDTIHEALARRFSRRVRGEMAIFVNGEALRPPRFEFESRFPEDGEIATNTLPDGNTVRYWYGFTDKPISSRDLRGFTILVHEKTAQAPPFYFNVEGTASGQHGTKYLTGEIHADYLDDGTDDETDIVSTDRQDIDWENEHAAPLLSWGDSLTRRLLRDWAHRKGQKLADTLEQDSEFEGRLARLDPPSRGMLNRNLRSLGQVEADPERARDLADVLIRAYEYRQFHSVVEQIDAANSDPDQLHTLLSHLFDWKVLESRAILEIINGRLSIVDKFREMIVNNERETAHAVGQDNMHDIIATYPWLVDPEWQVLAEEKQISSQLMEWNSQDIQDLDHRIRYDFLALTGDEGRLVVIEIKRSGHAIEIEELTRLVTYRERLATAHPDTYMMMIGSHLAISKNEEKAWEDRKDGEIVKWHDLHKRARRYYEHYRAVLEGDLANKNFALKQEEVLQTRRVLESGSYRGPQERAKGLGSQDIEHSRKPEA